VNIVSNYKYILDAGHGGVAFGHYLTKGKRSPQVPPGIYEGEFNRKICSGVPKLLDGCLDVMQLNPGPVNISLSSRVNYINELSALEKTILVSIHANASPAKGWSSANGFVVFHSTNASNESKELACIISDTMGKIVINSRGVKVSNFYILRKTKCPAVLVECGFMTNKEEAIMMNTLNGQFFICRAIANALRIFDKSL